MAKLAICGGTPVRTEPLVPWPFYDDREREALIRTLESRKWTSAPYVGEFPATVLEERFAAYNHAKHAVATGSGTDALQLAFAAAGVRAGDEVIVENPCFVSYRPIIRLCGGVPVPVPLHQENRFRWTRSQIEDAVTERTRAILFCTPHNPTGTVHTEVDLDFIAEDILD